jgi:hypothetical protein
MALYALRPRHLIMPIAVISAAEVTHVSLEMRGLMRITGVSYEGVGY